MSQAESAPHGFVCLRVRVPVPVPVPEREIAELSRAPRRTMLYSGASRSHVRGEQGALRKAFYRSPLRDSGALADARLSLPLARALGAGQCGARE